MENKPTPEMPWPALYYVGLVHKGDGMFPQSECPKFYVRCSGIGEIMTDPRGKSIADQIIELAADVSDRAAKIEGMKPGAKIDTAIQMFTQKSNQLLSLRERVNEPSLSETCKTHLKKWLIRELTGKRIDFKSRPTDKGNAVEDDAIVYASCHIPEMGLCCKNEKRYYDEWMTGTPDVVIPEQEVDDMKSSYSAETFPLFETELPEKDYDWQVVGYMGLLRSNGIICPKGHVIYALMSMPEEMIEREARYKLGQNYTRDQYEAFAANYQYDDLPPAMRLKKYPVEYDESKVQAIRDRVVECRNYIKTVLWPAYLANVAQF